jgi:uncharacterized protein YpmS
MGIVIWIVTVTLISVGALGYLDQIFGFKWNRKTLLLLLAIYLVLSVGQPIMEWREGNNEREQARQSEAQLRADLTSTQQQLAQQGEREAAIRQELADSQQ